MVVKVPSKEKKEIKEIKGDKGSTGLRGGVHTGPDMPTDPNITVWIDTSDETKSFRYCRGECLMDKKYLIGTPCCSAMN